MTPTARRQPCLASIAALASLLSLTLCLAAATPGHALDDLEWSPAQQRAMNRIAREARQHGKWWHARTEGWEVRTDTSLRLATEVVFLLQWYDDSIDAARLLPPIVDHERPTAMILRSRDDYERRAQRDGQGGHASWRWHGDELTEIGFYMALQDPRDLSLGSLRLETLRHEAMHCILQKRLGAVPVPSWFHEGYAQWFESWDPRLNAQANRERMSRSRGWATWFHALVADGNVPRLDAVIALRTSHDTWATGAGVRTGLNYAASFSVVDALVTDPQLADLKDRVWERLRRGRSQIIDDREIELLETRWHARLDERLTPADDRPDGSPTR